MHDGTLFTSDFLIQGIKDSGYWKSIPDDEVTRFRDAARHLYANFPTSATPNESQTERDLIDPLITALGWQDFLTQQTAASKGRSDVPDYLLFPDAEHKRRANMEKAQADKFRHGLAILEAKAWQTPLDRKHQDAAFEGVPSNQILRYLTIVDVHSSGAIRWGILTNGREWRLYYQLAKSRSEEFLGLDLPLILGLPGFTPDLFSADLLNRQDWLKVFYAFFRNAAFLPMGVGARPFHEWALDEGRHWEEKVAADLSDTVFRDVFPSMASALMEHDPQRPSQVDAAYLAEVREAVLILLYRLLFLLYAEDRNLLPVNDSKYDDYGLRKRVREDIRQRMDNRDVFSATASPYYRHVMELCRAVALGDDSIGLPPYNGGLFDTARAPILTRAFVPDAVFAPLLDKLSRRHERGRGLWINYRDLSVQQLGSIYERFLEYDLVEEKGGVTVRPNIFSRKTTGSYYTPESLVNLIIQNTAGPLIDEREAAFRKKSDELKSRRDSKQERLRELKKQDPSLRLLELRVLDPAMGSGHFLVSLVDYLADRLLILIEDTAAMVDWADYTSPLAENIRVIRQHILEEAAKHKWIVREDQLDDRHIVRRMILKRSVYGVDKNPMAVELAKVSLWLHTFTVGAPLSFLDHHLRAGDSLFGEFTYEVEEAVRERGSMFIGPAVRAAQATAKGMAVIEELTDADIAEVKESAKVFTEVAKGSRPLTRFYGFIHALRWMDTKGKDKQGAITAFVNQAFGDPIAIAADAAVPKGGGAAGELFTVLLAEARQIADEENFFHWEVAFPKVWDRWESKETEGGFDAVISNPPWDRIKLQEVEWFAARKPEIALATRAADRKKMVEKLEKSGDPLWQAYEKAARRAKAASDVASGGGHYPKLGRGDINLYSLFVERAHRLVKPEGLVGLLTPSGIASDLGASEFFKSVATTGRLGCLYDFENKKVFFPDIDSRFKFCVYVAGGAKRKFKKSRMAFFLHKVEELEERGRVFALTAEDFARVNPNTGTAPIFRTRLDAEITRRVYESFPVLHEHGKPPVWPVKYFTMFHMTNDSGLFKTKAELEKEGFYPVAGNRMKRGKEECVPLYEGKMVQAYDHRAASVVVNPENLNRPAQPEAATEEQHSNPQWLPASQFWVNSDTIKIPEQLNWYVAFKEITAATNMRTMIATIIPRYAANNKLPILIPSEEKNVGNYAEWGPLLLANLNAFAFDFIVRQKTHSTTLNWFIVEQFPIIPPKTFEGKIGKTKIADLVRDHVLRFTYTASDMAGFAHDMGCEGKPFKWDPEERRHLRARLDALFFILYGLSRDDADYILSTFPIVKKDDEAAHGRYLTRDLILAYMNALAAGDAKSKVTA